MSEAAGLSIMVWSCGPDAADRAATPFMVAQAAAAMDMQVEMLFTAQALHWLLREQQATPIGFGPERMAVGRYVEAVADAGVELRACSQALAALQYGKDDLVPQCAGLGGTVAFVERTFDPAWRTLVF